MQFVLKIFDTLYKANAARITVLTRNAIISMVRLGLFQFVIPQRIGLSPT